MLTGVEQRSLSFIKSKFGSEKETLGPSETLGGDT